MDDADKLLLARDAYQAYSNITGNKNYQGLEMHQFEELPSLIQYAWIAATQNVLDHTQVVAEEAGKPDQQAYLAAVGERFPGLQSWAASIRVRGGFLSFVVYDLRRDPENPLYVFAADRNNISDILLAQDGNETILLAMTWDEYQRYVESGGKDLPEGFPVKA